MVYIFCALYAEASDIIEKYDLKKQGQGSGLKFDVFKNEEDTITLTLTGPGLLNAATALASVCTFYGAGISDRIINIGICAGKDEPGTLVIANKVINQMTDKTFYPDMILKSGLPERTLVTCVGVKTREEVLKADKNEIFDMEAAGIFEAAVFFVAQHGVSFLKLVSDGGVADGNDLNNVKNNVKGMMRTALPQVAEYIDMQQSFEEKANCSEPFFENGTFTEYVAGLSDDMHCSVTMQNRLGQLIRYSYLAGIDYRKIVETYYKEGILPVKNKNDGKKVLDELAGKLI